ncbi:MAG: protein translocase subunit SecF [Candidatus Sericytochromatia bacterium]|nr:protein translocase subunit SecF [Candidatus Sericytochromatia bacterium]
MAMRFEDSSFNFMNKKALWFGISGLLLVPGIVAIVMCFLQFGAPVKLGIDFTGGTLAQLTFEKGVTAQDVKTVVAGTGHPDVQVQIADGKTALIRTKAMASPERQAMLDALKGKLGAFKADRFESVGPTVGKELLLNSLSAVGLTLLGIIGYVSFRYQFDFAMCAISALIHDVLFILGVFAILGLALGVEVDSLFVTAVLTVVGFSVHDTIIIYDRIRENMRTAGKRDTFDDVANRSIKQTLARSINTSLTVCLTLIAMLIFGGETVRWFVLAMLLGIAVGTYSSIFNASQLLSAWRMLGVKQTT